MKRIFGQKRQRRGFLLLPKTINYEWRWLEFAAWEEEWLVGYEHKGWAPTKWLSE